ncbi:aldehyde dehydrogenase [bacterium]|nr:aldehyde dehydrogenase [Candidatus Neomarinimicrobiota bacterium]MDC0645925.1 aldehyde dehydrogenase [bacterium]MDC1038095.1 aldehyde dehydrogenase [Candidatus Neomarinimicrobiota bacterium]
MDKLCNFINGKFVAPNSNQYLEIFEPATGQIYAQVADSNSTDIENAYESAQNAFGNWSSLSVKERADYLNKIAEGLESRLDEFAEYESRDTGKPISLAKSVDIPRAVSNFRFFAEYGQEFNFESELNNDQSHNKIIRSALGVIGCISPWNLPLYLFSWKIAPALIAGNTVVAKPSEITPFTAFKLGEICQDTGLPPGVLNIIHGQGSIAGDALVNHSKIKAISFTGGTTTGKLITKKTASSFKKLSLEMGGKNPSIVFSDCDFDKMMKTVVRSSFSNQGQICLCSSRILVEESIYEKFKTNFIQRVSDLRMGDPSEIETQFGALSSKGHFDKVIDYIEIAKQEGGKILVGGNAKKLNGRCGNGWFIEPTIIEGLNNSCRTNQEEIFGPLVTLQSFKSEKDAIQLANETEYGLSATIWTEDNEKANRVSTLIDAGVIWVNCWLVRDLRTPFGGMKQSGLGREGGDEALRFFTEPKNICTLA